MQRVRHRLTRLARRRAPRPLHRAGDRPRRVRPLRCGPGRKHRRRAHRAGLRRPAAALHRRPEQGQYDFAACNPPYFTAGPRSPDPRRAEARHTGSCTTADAVDCARRALRDGGRFLLCQRPEQLAEILAALRAARLEPKRLAFVKNRPDAAPWLFLVEAQKGRKTGLRVEPDILIQSGAALYGPTAL